MYASAQHFHTDDALMPSCSLSQSFALGGADTQARSEFTVLTLLFLDLHFILFVLVILVMSFLALSLGRLPFLIVLIIFGECKIQDMSFLSMKLYLKFSKYYL